MRKKVLIVNCYFDDLRLPVKRKLRIPQAMGPAFLAGAFSKDLCDIKLYNEQYSGPLEDECLLSFPDMLVLTGLNTAFDRMLHLTAYARTKNKNVIVVAGGPAIRALPQYAIPFFDFCCTGDVEALKEIIIDSFGEEYVSDALMEHGWVLPRYDLTYWIKIGGYVESSRNCYFSCSFCSLTAENRPYRQYDMKYVEQQFKALGRRRHILFIDNNFGGGSKKFLEDRLSYLHHLKKHGRIKNWSAMVSSEFLLSEENLQMAKQAGCMGLFCGVESFDTQSIINFNKTQNIRLPQIELIKRCLNSRILFSYGLLLDISCRTVNDMKEEIAFILNSPEIPLPSYISFAIPMLKTPFFYECVKNKRLLPNIKIRDLDSATLTISPKDSFIRVVKFIKETQNFIGFRRKAILHTKRFYQVYRKNIPLENIHFYLNGPVLQCLPNLVTIGPDVSLLKVGRRNRTYVGSTEPLDDVYRPAFRVDSRFERYFQPTMLTDETGDINKSLLPDLVNCFELADLAN